MRAGGDGRMEDEERDESVWQRNEAGDLVAIFKCHNNAQLHRGAGAKYLRALHGGRKADFSEG